MSTGSCWCPTPTLLRLAQDVSLMGPLALENTWTKIVQQFYWPGIMEQIRISITAHLVPSVSLHSSQSIKGDN